MPVLLKERETCGTTWLSLEEKPSKFQEEKLFFYQDKASTFKQDSPSFLCCQAIGESSEIPAGVTAPAYLYVSYGINGAIPGTIYRYSFTPPGEFGSAELLTTLDTNHEVLHMSVDEEVGIIMVSENDTNTVDTHLRKYNASTGVLLNNFETRTGNPRIAGLQNVRSEPGFLLTDVGAALETVLLYDYDYNLIRTLRTNPVSKIIAPSPNSDDTEATWYEYIPPTISEKFWRANIDGSGSPTEISTGAGIGTSGERQIGRADTRETINPGNGGYFFLFNPQESKLQRLPYNNMGSLTEIATLLTPNVNGNGMAVNFFSERVAYAYGPDVRWVDYDGGEDQEIVASITGSPRVQSLCWGY